MKESAKILVLSRKTDFSNMNKFFFGGEMDENETLLMDTYTSGGGSSSSGNAYFTDFETPFGNGSGQNIMNQSVQQRLNNGTLKEPDPTMVFNSSHLVSIITYSCLFVFSAAGKNYSPPALMFPDQVIYCAEITSTLLLYPFSVMWGHDKESLCVAICFNHCSTFLCSFS